MAAIIIIAVIAVILVVVNIRVVQQARAFVIERLGAYKETWNVGLHVKMPFIDRVAKIVSLKEQVADFPPQPVITKDNVTMQIDTRPGATPSTIRKPIISTTHTVAMPWIPSNMFILLPSFSLCLLYPVLRHSARGLCAGIQHFYFVL